MFNCSPFRAKKIYSLKDASHLSGKQIKKIMLKSRLVRDNPKNVFTGLP